MSKINHSLSFGHIKEVFRKKQWPNVRKYDMFLLSRLFSSKCDISFQTNILTFTSNVIPNTKTLLEYVSHNILVYILVSRLWLGNHFIQWIPPRMVSVTMKVSGHVKGQHW